MRSGWVLVLWLLGSSLGWAQAVNTLMIDAPYGTPSACLLYLVSEGVIDQASAERNPGHDPEDAGFIVFADRSVDLTAAPPRVCYFTFVHTDGPSDVRTDCPGAPERTLTVAISGDSGSATLSDRRKIELQKCDETAPPRIAATGIWTSGLHVWKNCAIEELGKSRKVDREAAVDDALNACRYLGYAISADMHRADPRWAGESLRQLILDAEKKLKALLLSRAG